MVLDLCGAINSSGLSVSGGTGRWKMTSWHLHVQPNWLLVFTGGTAGEQHVPPHPRVSGSQPGSVCDCCGQGVSRLLCSAGRVHRGRDRAMEPELGKASGSRAGSQKPKGCPEHL